MSKKKQSDADDAPATVDSIDVEVQDGADVGYSTEPAWLADPDYTGPLTCDQASRRLARHGHHVTKPEEGPVKK